MSKAPKPKIMLIDGNALVHRGFHAIPPLHNQAGLQTNAVYGFCAILLRAIKDLKPTHVACAFDLAGPTFRHEVYKEYKATRVKAPDELYQQIPMVKDVVKSLNIPIFEKQGFEADDVLGTLSHKLYEHYKGECDIMLVTGDLDTLQLVNHSIKVYTLRQGISDVAIYDAKAVKARYGLLPSQMVDYKALRGDPSDNIKGVPGIGEKTAAELIQKFGSLAELYEKIKNQKSKIKNQIKPKILEKLAAHEKGARLSYELSKIVLNVPLNPEIPEYHFTQNHLTKTLALFKKLEFSSLVGKLPKNYNGQKSASRGLEDLETQRQKQAKRQHLKQEYVLVDSQTKLQDLLKKLDNQRELAVDTETTSLSPVDARLVGVSLSFQEGVAYYVPAEIVLASESLKALLAGDASAFASATADGPLSKFQRWAKIGHNIKYDQQVLSTNHLALSPISFDTMIASYLLNAGTRQHNLDTLAFNEFGYQKQPTQELIGKGSKQITMDRVEVKKVAHYACEDADFTWRLKQLYEPKLKEQGLDKIFYDIEMPLVEVLASMERWGVKLDSKLLGDLSKTARARIKTLEKQIYKLTGQEFNIASPKQLKEVLFDKLGLVSPDNKKTKTGLSTAAGELEKMLGQHPAIKKILEYRELAKLESTYLQALPALVSPKTGRLHTSYNQTIAATGRLSSTDPNLQNIPVRGQGLGAEVRKAFVAEAGYKLLSLDYSQIELRIVAHLAQDKAMMQIFKSGEDIHTMTAKAIFGLPSSPSPHGRGRGEGAITADMRRDAKTINFGILYGLSSFGLSSRILEIGRAEAKEFIEKYFKAYPGVRAYIEKIKAQVNDQGWVRNELGRLRKFPEIRSSQYFVRAAAERAAVNFPIQSLAADVIKVAMINIFKELSTKNLALSAECKMLLQVHDELVFEVKADKVAHYAKMLKPIMEEAISLSVPVLVEAKAGDNWGEMESLDL